MKDAGMTYNVKEVKAGPGASVVGYPSSSRCINTSVTLQGSMKDTGGHGSPSMKEVPDAVAPGKDFYQEAAKRGHVVK